MKYSLRLAAVLALAMAPLGCNDGGGGTTTRTTERTTTTTREAPPPASTASGNVDVNAGPNGATATARDGANGTDDVDVDVTPGGGVGVEVQGEPIRDRIRERRAAREANTPR